VEDRHFDTNIPLSTLSVTASEYSRLRLIIERDQALQKYQQLDQQVKTLSATQAEEANESTQTPVINYGGTEAGVGRNLSTFDVGC